MMLEKMKPYFAVIFLQFGNAGLVIIAKAALNHGMNHYTFAVYRNLIATLVITPFALFFESKGRPKLTISIFFKIMLLGFLEPVVDQNLYYAGMKYTTATFAIVGTLVTVGGAMIMTVVAGPTIGLPWTKGSTTDHQQQSTTPPVSPADNIKGSMMIIAGCVSWSFFYIVQAITLRSYPAELSLTALICAAGTMQGSIVTIIAERGNNEAWRLHLDAGLVTMVYGGVICSGLGYYLSGIIMKEKGPVFVTAFNPLSMVIVAVLGSIVLSEQMNLGRVLGAAVIVIGLYLVIWGKSKDESQSNSKCDPDQLPPVNQQQIPMTISSTKLAKEDQDSLSIAIPPTNETVVKINGK
ncbi:Drug/metabolite transporter [Cynara cardunculus var. scolymus]|uniref:WAT1-related protein n=1 Tax=Cynara cardunculus var. scolymus TaxID=59895 RepID=A0A103Y9G9_CYNCS|nr:Drug/metabolite transporter [Cynara cardunculus var. scolymus]